LSILHSAFIFLTPETQILHSKTLWMCDETALKFSFKKIERKKAPVKTTKKKKNSSVSDTTTHKKRLLSIHKEERRKGRMDTHLAVREALELEEPFEISPKMKSLNLACFSLLSSLRCCFLLYRTPHSLFLFSFNAPNY